MGVAVRRYIDVLIIIITFPYTPLVYSSSFFATASLFLYSFFYPSSTSKDKVNNRTYITITENFTFTLALPLHGMLFS